MKQITEAQVKNVDRKLQISIKTNFIITFQSFFTSTISKGILLYWFLEIVTFKK